MWRFPSQALFGLLILVSAGCACKAPIQEYTLARTALRAAKSAGGPSEVPGLYQKADSRYQEAKSQFDDQLHCQAQTSFIKAKKVAEDAENAVRLKKFKSGEIFE